VSFEQAGENNVGQQLFSLFDKAFAVPFPPAFFHIISDFANLLLCRLELAVASLVNL